MCVNADYTENYAPPVRLFLEGDNWGDHGYGVCVCVETVVEK